MLFNSFDKRVYILSLLSIFLGLFFPEKANAVTLFGRSFDSNTRINYLVKIDSNTGQINPVGILDTTDGDFDFASINGRLFATGRNGNSNSNTRVNLYEIDPETAEIISSSSISLNGDKRLFAEGLLSINGKLRIAFSQTFGMSSVLGDLSLDGMITNTTNTGVDFDALGGDGVTSFFAIDEDGNSNSPQSLLEINPTNGTVSSLKNIDFNALINDLTVAKDRVFYIGNNSLGTESWLFETSLTGTEFKKTLLPPSIYGGLASIDIPQPVPTPALLPGLIGMSVAALRKRKQEAEVES
jgi:hypothetical protein